MALSDSWTYWFWNKAKTAHVRGAQRGPSCYAGLVMQCLEAVCLAAQRERLATTRPCTVNTLGI